MEVTLCSLYLNIPAVVFTLRIFVMCYSEEINADELILNYTQVDNKFLEGKKQYEDFSNKVINYGDCWKKAVLDLHTGCKHLTEDIQSRLALSFANCFLEHSGLKTCPCAMGQPLKICLKNADDRTFSTYREFFTHTKSICYFLQHQTWQEQTENTIVRLSFNSEKVSKQLDKSTKSQTAMLHLQQIALQKQHQLINNSESLSFALERSRNNAVTIFEEFKSATNEQRMLIFEIFDHIRKLETVVLGEFTGVYTFIYYLVAVVLSYLLTSTPRTAEARIWLLVIVTVNAVLERVVAVYSIEEETGKQVLLDADGPIYYRIWLCRKVSCIVASSMLVICSCRYKDYNVINNRLLLEIQKQNLEMQIFIKSIDPNNIGISSNCDTKESCTLNQIQNGVPILPGLVSEKSADEDANILPLVQNNGIGDNNLTHLNHEEEHSLPIKQKKAPRKKTKLIRTAALVNEYQEDEISSDQSEIEFQYSPSPRYNLRNRSRLSTPESSSMQTPRRLSRSVKEAAIVSLENSEKIRKKVIQYNRSLVYSDDD